MIEEEKRILSDLDSTDVFNMRGRIKNYILDNVQLNRKGLKLTVEK